MATIGTDRSHQGWVYGELDAANEETYEISVAGVVTVQVTDGGSFAGTVVLQREVPGGSFVTVEGGSWTEADLPVTKTIVESHQDVRLKLVCSARTAGSALCSITSQVMPD